MNLNIIVLAVSIGLGLSGCGTPAAPKCADESTIALVKQIVINSGIKSKAMKAEDEADVRTRLSVSAIRTQGLDKEVGKYRCAAEVKILRVGKTPWQSNITYTSEKTDDGNQQYVSVYGLNF